MHQDHNACGSLTVIMSSQEASKWAIKTAKLHPTGPHVDRFNYTTTVTNTLDEVAIFVLGGGGFNVENGHEIASSPNCGRSRRYSIQIIVKLEESVKKLQVHHLRHQSSEDQLI